MKDRPILFSGPMVAAILAGRKSQTRRVVKQQPERRPVLADDGEWYDADGINPGRLMRCKFGQPGSRLWVRETWAVCGLAHGMKPSHAAKIASPDAWRYEADDTTGWQHGWKPSIHMPRAASRITLEITGVRCERLQDISADDAKAEGLGCVTKDGSLYKYGIPDLDGLPGNDNHGWHWQEWEKDPRNAYHKLWEKINGPGSAVDNPWVWAIEFKRVSP